MKKEYKKYYYYSKEEYFNIIDLIKKLKQPIRFICMNRSNNDIKKFGVKNIPSYPAVIKFSEKNSSFKKKLIKAHQDYLSFKQQADAKILGSRFIKAVDKLSKNMSIDEISKELEVSIFTVKKAYDKLGIEWRKKNG